MKIEHGTQDEVRRKDCFPLQSHSTKRVQTDQSWREEEGCSLNCSIVSMYCIVSNTMKKLFGFRKKKKGTSHVSSASLNSYQQGDAVLTKTNLPPKSNVLHPESVNQVPFLVQELQNCKKTSSDHAARILRKLFTLSEQPNGQSVEVTRKEMIQDGKLVPALFAFCERCREEPEQQQENGVVQQPQLYLALLVLNNISIPMENKRKIALDYHGAAFLSKFLCDEPSCHLVAIVLVNLTFADAALRKDLVLTPGIHLMESLAFAFRVASMTTAEYISHKESLEDPKIEAVLTWLPKVDSAKDLPPPSSQKYPDTVRWTISAIRNLTRPTPGNPSIVALINTGVVTCILQSLSIRLAHMKTADVSFESLSSNESPVATEPLERGYENHPSTWGAQSYQDAALSVILNLATDPSTRSYLRKETDTMQVLVSITECGATLDKTFGKKTSAITRLQCIKARMALAYLLGSEGHFGQAKSETGRMVYYPGSNSDFLTTNESELEHLVELFSNTLERRAKDGPGGYSATAFNFKSVLFAIRCLLSHPTNQAIFAATQMEEFNGLFLKVLGLHALQQAKMVDTEAAEYACFSMYLLSHYGFHVSVSTTKSKLDFLTESLLPLFFFSCRNHSSREILDEDTTYAAWWQRS